ncbi:MAG: tetratricopeptide repeat protein, partial [Candidatus Zixiibacteriota bacterium]
ALSYHRLALAVDSTFPEVNLNMGVCFFRQGDDDSARCYFEREARLHPLRAKSWVNLASLELVNGRVDQALAYASRAVEKRPFDITANMILVRAAAASDQVSDDSLSSLARWAVERAGADVFLLSDMAQQMVQRGLFALAESLLERSITTRPPPIETDDEAFRPNYRNIPDNRRRRQARAHFQLGYLYGQQQRYREAVYQSDLAVRKDSTLAEAYVNLISGLMATGEFLRARSVVDVAAKRFPQDTLIGQLKVLLMQ